MQTTENSKQYESSALVKRIAKNYVKKYANNIVFAVVFMGIFAFCNSFQVWLVRPALDEIFVTKNVKFLWIIPALILLVSIIKGIADYFQNYTIRTVGQSIVNDLQLDLYRHLMMADLQFLHKHSSGNLISRFTNDVLNLRNSISAVIVSFAKEVMTVIFLIGVMFYNDITLSLIAFIVFPIAVIPISKAAKKMKKSAHKTQEELCDYTVKLDENFRNIKVIKSFCTENYEINESKSKLDRLLDCYKKVIRIESLTSPIMEMLGALGVSAIIIYGGYQVLSGHTTPGSFFSFIVAFIYAYQPVKTLANLSVNLQNGLASAKRIFMILDTKSRQYIPATKNLHISSAPEIKFNDIRFAYENGKGAALKDVSFVIEKNKFVAIVGESGSGKSTLIDLLMNFYSPESGSITIDGMDISKVSHNSLRKHIALVSQDIMLFDKSIRDNINYGSKKSNDKIVKSAAHAANADGFIEELPDQYNTNAGQFAIQLSGGQRQKIAIARALLKDSSIIVMDEATSALDQVSEQMIKDFLLPMKSKKTIVMITHRLSTIKDADVIYVMKNGMLVEYGNHNSLIRHKSEYYKLYNKKTVEKLL